MFPQNEIDIIIRDTGSRPRRTAGPRGVKTEKYNQLINRINDRGYYHQFRPSLYEELGLTLQDVKIVYATPELKQRINRTNDLTIKKKIVSVIGREGHRKKRNDYFENINEDSLIEPTELRTGQYLEQVQELINIYDTDDDEAKYDDCGEERGKPAKYVMKIKSDNDYELEPFTYDELINGVIPYFTNVPEEKKLKVGLELKLRIQVGELTKRVKGSCESFTKAQLKAMLCRLKESGKARHGNGCYGYDIERALRQNWGVEQPQPQEQGYETKQIRPSGLGTNTETKSNAFVYYIEDMKNENFRQVLPRATSGIRAAEERERYLAHRAAFGLIPGQRAKKKNRFDLN